MDGKTGEVDGIISGPVNENGTGKQKRIGTERAETGEGGEAKEKIIEERIKEESLLEDIDMTV
jgi:hypothetical protein